MNIPINSKDVTPRIIKELTNTLKLIPGIGPKSARRIAFFLINQPNSYLKNFADILTKLKSTLIRCSFCNVVSETDPCSICADEQREKNKIVIVRHSLHLFALEQIKIHSGYYFVFDYQIFSVSEITNDPEYRKLLKMLLRRVEYLLKQTDKELEIIFAFSANFEDEALLLDIKKALTEKFDKKIVITRFAIGLQPGSDIDFVDEFTLEQSYKSRQKT